MRRKIAALCITMAVAGLVVFVATGLGSGDGASVTTKTVRVHHVAAPSGAAGASAKRGGGFSIVYKESAPKDLTAGTSYHITITTCPRRSAVLNGYFQTKPVNNGVIANGGSPHGLRKWHVDVTASQNRSIVVGLVCVKG